MEAALDVVNGFRDRPAGPLRLNVPGQRRAPGAARDRAAFLRRLSRHPAGGGREDSFVDVLAAGCDAGIRYDERLEQDMIAVPIGPRVQRFADAASPAYLDAPQGRPSTRATCSRTPASRPLRQRRDDALGVRARRRDRARRARGPLVVRLGAATDLAVAAAVAGSGIIQLFEDWLRPDLDRGALVPVLEDWWQRFSGPFLYYPGRRLVPRRCGPSSISSKRRPMAGDDAQWSRPRPSAARPDRAIASGLERGPGHRNEEQPT